MILFALAACVLAIAPTAPASAQAYRPGCPTGTCPRPAAAAPAVRIDGRAWTNPVYTVAAPAASAVKAWHRGQLGWVYGTLANGVIDFTYAENPHLAGGNGNAAPAPAMAPAGDPLGPINALRANHGLAPLAYDASLSASAAQNNAACQARYGGGCPSPINGLHIVLGAGRQCAGWNYGDARAAAWGWYTSHTGHREIVLDPAARRAGIALAGRYSTLNVAR